MTWTHVTPAFTHEVAKGIDGEYTAIMCYDVLQRKAPTAEDRNIILAIRRDEIRHYEDAMRIYQRLTGHSHNPRQLHPCAHGWREGLRAAFKDEQETSALYRRLANETRDPMIRDYYLHAAADEQRHAVWLLFLLYTPEFARSSTD